jgi:hypothetical protein
MNPRLVTVHLALDIEFAPVAAKLVHGVVKVEPPTDVPIQTGDHGVRVQCDITLRFSQIRRY